MNIEIVEFYLEQQDNAKKSLKGTLHIYLPECDIDLRGVIVSRRKDFWFFGLPSKVSVDQETGQKIKYPIFTFTDSKKMGILLSNIREKGKSYIIKKMNILNEVE
jgi:hypothetical protein